MNSLSVFLNINDIIDDKCLLFLLLGILFIIIGILILSRIKTKWFDLSKSQIWPAIIAFIVGIVFLILRITLCNPTPPCLIKYNFENRREIWSYQKEGDSKACTMVTRTDSISYEGSYSLKLAFNIIGNSLDSSKGEAWVDMRAIPPIDDLAMPINLNKKTISMWIYAPNGSIGDYNSPNGIQLFVKDKNYKCEYGMWQPIIENQWFRVTLNICSDCTEIGYIDRDFNPDEIVIVGVKMGAGGNSYKIFKGDIYIDYMNCE
jgi:hypothetical protein